MLGRTRNGPRPPNCASAAAAMSIPATVAARTRAHRRSTAGLALRIEAVADPRFGHEIPRVGRVGLELLAKLSHEDAQVLGLLLRRFAPYGLEQRAVRQHTAGMPRHVQEQFELLRGQPHLGAAHVNAPRLEIDAKIAGVK